MLNSKFALKGEVCDSKSDKWIDNFKFLILKDKETIHLYKASKRNASRFYY